MNGNLYASSVNRIIKYKTSDGSLSATFKENYSGPIAIDKDNNIFQLNSEGTILARYDQIIEKVNKHDPSIGGSLAVDNSNNIYILSEYSNKIYTYDSNGEFIKYLDPQWNDPDKSTTNPETISIDTNNNLYINNFNGNYKFDINGNLINLISKVGSHSMVTNSNGYTYILTLDGSVLKYASNNPT